MTQAETSSASLERLRILVVDDEDFVRDVTARALVSLGATKPSQARNGREALELLGAGGPECDVVICDLHMPDMDGLELVRHLSEGKARPALLFLSGAQSSLRRAAESLGRAYGFQVLGAVAKPVAKSQLSALLQDVKPDPIVAYPRTRPVMTLPDVEQALERGEFLYHYQPKVWVANGALDSVEALARWQHPQHGLLAPASFISLVEASPLIGPFTEQLVSAGMRQLATWQNKGLKLAVAMNLSPSMLSDVDMPDRFARAAADLSVNPESIVFEITETGVAEHEAVYLEIIARLNMKGFRISIDDFGTGQSSLQKLEALPFAELKIDRQFVHGLHRSGAKRAIFEASVGLARRFNLKTIAEGAEHPEDLRILGELGCDIVQGFIISKPLAVPELEAWAASH